MLYTGAFKDIKSFAETHKDGEVWVIARSLNAPKEKDIAIVDIPVYHVPVLSPSTNLLKDYLELKRKGMWNVDAFERAYKPEFMKEMESEDARECLHMLRKESKTKDILLVCFCKDESMCHRSLVRELILNMTESENNLIPTNPDALSIEPTKMPIRHKTENVGKVLCFTGRRPKDLCDDKKKAYQRATYNEMVEAIKESLRYLIKLGYGTFISGGAQGFDQLAFWAVNSLKREEFPHIKNIVYVPFNGQETGWFSDGYMKDDYGNFKVKKWKEKEVDGEIVKVPAAYEMDMEDIFSKAMYHLMLGHADEVVLVNPGELKKEYVYDEVTQKEKVKSTLVTPDGKEVAVSKTWRLRNYAMVAASDAVFGLFPDKTWHNESVRSSTAECLRYATSKRVPIFQLSNATFQCWWESAPSSIEQSDILAVPNIPAPATIAR